MNSVLNPEAPEFHPLLTNAVQDGLVQANKVIRTSNRFPVRLAYDVYRTYTDFGIVTYHISENVVLQSNQIVVAEIPEVKLTRREPSDNNTDKIIDVNDSLLDRININIDTITGVNKSSDQFMKSIPEYAAVWNNKPVITKIQLGNATFIGAKNIPRPQLTFKDPVDNSYNLWVPKITEKPNNIKPLALNILYDQDGVPISYEHPYTVELDLYRPPACFIKPDAVAPTFPLPITETPLTLVDTEAKLDELVKHLHECDEIAVDVEHHAYRTYQGITCLIQITTYKGGDFIIDTLAIREHVHKLNNSFTDPKKVKILHGAENDVKWLQRDFGVYIVGLFDTFHAGRLLKLPSLSLKNLLTRYCNVHTDKKYQLADWRIRPLPKELIEYARVDTHYLLYMWRVMKQQLLDLAAGRPTLLLSAFEYSRQTSCVTFNKEVMDDVCHMGMYTRSKKSFNSQQLSALRVMYKWRDAQAREMDEGPSYLIPNHMLLNLAENLPHDVQGISSCCAPMPPFMKVNVLAIHRMILSCRELPLEDPYQEETANETQHAHCIPSVHDFADYPDVTEDQINLEMVWTLMDQNVVEIDGVRLDVSPDVTALAPAAANLSAGVVSTLNVDAEMFIPPYDRYRAYKNMTQAKQIKDLKEKEAKVAALSQGNEFIKDEVLGQLQAQRARAEANYKLSQQQPELKEIPDAQPKKPIEVPDDQPEKPIINSEDQPQKPTESPEDQPEKPIEIPVDQPEKPTEIPDGESEKAEETPDDEHEKLVENPDETTEKIVVGAIEKAKATKKASQRKRKIEKAAAIQQTDDKKKEPQKAFKDEQKVKSFHYKNVNYKKFFSESEKGHKQPKMKFKKS